MRGNFETHPNQESISFRETIFCEQVLDRHLEYCDQNLQNTTLLEVGGGDGLSLSDKLMLVDMTKSYLGLDPSEPGQAAHEAEVTFIGRNSGKRVVITKRYRLYETDTQANGYLLCEYWYDPNYRAENISVQLFNRDDYTKEEIMESLR